MHGIWRIALIAAALTATLSQDSSYACFGSLTPRCAQSVYVAKWAPRVVVHPGAGQDIIVPVGVAPYAEFSTLSSCADPVDATLTLKLTCEPQSGGASIMVGPRTVPSRVPTSAGIQQTFTGPGGTAETGGTYDFVIPAGTLPPGTQYRCRVEGTYTVTFAGGIGDGTVTGGGDTEVYVVDPSELDPTVPRLNMYAIGDYAGAVRARRGDQVIVCYAIENNSNQALSFDQTLWSNQIARMPTGTSTARYSISLPDGGDHASIGLANSLRPGGLLDSEQFLESDMGLVNTSGLLGPHEVRIICVAVRSHGMCADGSCSDFGVRLSGTFSDGAPAIACASGTLIVSDVEACTPLYEVSANVLPGPFDTVDFPPVVVNGDPHLSIFGNGNKINDNPSEEGADNHLEGILRSGALEYGAEIFGYVRTEQLPTWIDADMIYRTGSFSFLNGNDLRIDLTNTMFPAEFSVPMLSLADAPITNHQVAIGLAKDTLKFSLKKVQQNGQIKLQLDFSGSFQAVIGGQESKVTPDQFSHVEFGVLAPSIGGWSPFRAAPGALAGTFANQGDFEAFSEFIDLQVSPLLSPAEDFTVGTNISGLSVRKESSGPDGGRIQVTAEPAGFASIAESPKSTTGTFTVSVPGGGTLAIGGIFRRLPDDAKVPELAAIPKLGALFRQNKTDNDKASLLIFVTPTLASNPEKKKPPFPETCRDGVLDIGGLVRRFALDEKGKFKSADKQLIVKGKLLKDGQLQLKVKLKKSSLAGFFAHFGLLDADVPKPGLARTIAVRLFLCDTVYAGAADVVYTAKLGKTGKLKSPKNK